MEETNRELTTPLARSWNEQFPATRIGLAVLTVILAVTALLVFTGQV